MLVLKVQIFRKAVLIRKNMYASYNCGYSLDDFIAIIYKYIDDAVYNDKKAFFYYDDENIPNQIIFANRIGQSFDEDVVSVYFKIY